MNNAFSFPFERNRYFYGKLLTVRDFEVEQRYHCTKRELLNRLLHGAGVVCGLGVTASDESTLMIESGMALDYQGREIILPEPIFRKLPMLEGQDTLKGRQDAVENMVHVKDVFKPDPQNAAKYRELYEKAYVKIYPSVRHIYFNIYNMNKKRRL